MAGGYDIAEKPVAVGDDAVMEETEDPVDKDVANKGDGDNDLPELMELLDAVEEIGDDVAGLATIIFDIGRRIRRTPGDRDLLTDFEGITNICKSLSTSPQEWQGEPMLAFCKIMPDVCRTSNVNRGSLRDEGFLLASVEYLRMALVSKDEAAATAAAMAMSAMCTANDGNKKVAAQLLEMTPEKPGGIMLCLDALAYFEDSAPLQTEAIGALRSLLTDDDPRKSDSTPSAQDNCQVALGDEGFPFVGMAVERALNLADASDKPQMRLREQALLLLREVARRKEYITALALDAKLLPRVMAMLSMEDPRVVRAVLAVVRAFCANEDVRDEVGMLTDGAHQCLLAVYKHVKTPVVCEQGFGLFANLTMHKGPVAGNLNASEKGVVALGQQVLREHSARPDVMRSVVQTLRNVATQDDAVSQEVKESDIFELVRGLVKAHEGDSRWKSAVDISRQFLREFRADQGIEKKAVYNQFY